MKVLACSSLVLMVLVVMAAGNEQEIPRGQFWNSFFANMTADVCAGPNAQLCQANAARCYQQVAGDRFKVQTEEMAGYAKQRFIDCAQRLSVDADFSPVTLKTFEEDFPMPGYGFDGVAFFLHYGVPVNKFSPMFECSGAEMLAFLRQCLVSNNDENQV